MLLVSHGIILAGSHGFSQKDKRRYAVFLASFKDNIFSSAKVIEKMREWLAGKGK